LVAFSLSEGTDAASDLAGSRVYARGAIERGERLVAAVTLDSLASFTRSGAQAQAPELEGEWPRVGDFVALIAAAKDRDLLDQAAAGFAEGASLPHATATWTGDVPVALGPSDASGFVANGVPTIRVTDTAKLRDPRHGTAEDIATRVAFEDLARVVAGLESMVLELGGRPVSRLVTDPKSGRLRPDLE
jgi:hypothetical protein